MTIVKINVHKVNAHKNLDAKVGQVKINNNVSVTNVEDMDFAVDGKKGLKFTFTFVCKYEPDLGTIDVEGQVLYVGKEDDVNAVKESWTNAKKVPSTVMEHIVNAALHKGNIQAIKISEDINLPSPLPLPKVKPAAPESSQVANTTK
jgi:hypothetical protein|tara:strand:- start:216 stop:656 length:441 start_codon:yes stop_codon:yes gene_type:complete